MRRMMRLLYRLLGARPLPADPESAVEYLNRLSENAGRRWERRQGEGGAR